MVCSLVGLGACTGGGYYYYTRVMSSSAGAGASMDGLAPDLAGEFDGVGVGVAAASTRTDEMLRRYNPDYTAPAAPEDAAAAGPAQPAAKEGYEPGEVEMADMPTTSGATSGDYDDGEDVDALKQKGMADDDGEEVDDGDGYDGSGDDEEELEADEESESSVYDEEVDEEGVELQLDSPDRPTRY